MKGRHKAHSLVYMIWLLADSSTASSASREWWNGAIGPAIGGFISLASTVGVTWWTAYRKRKEDRIRLAATLAGELKGIVTFLANNQIEKSLRDASTTASSDIRPNVQKIPALRGSFLEASGSIESSVALLPTRLALEVAELIILLRGTIEEFTTIRKACETRDTWTASDFAQFCVQLADLVKLSEASAKSLIPKLLEVAKLPGQ